MNGELHQFAIQVASLAARVGAVMYFGPFFGSAAIPARVKTGITLILTGVLFPIYGKAPVAPHAAGIFGPFLGQIAIGLCLGLATQIVMEGAMFAGQIVGIQLGFSLVNILDPQTSVDTPVMSVFNQMLVLLVYLQLNVHHWVIRALVKSFEISASTGPVVSAEAVRQLLRMSGKILSIGVEIAAPIVAATVMIDIVFGLIGRMSPQIPVLFLGISVKSTVGLAILCGSLALWPKLFERYFDDAMHANATLFRALLRI